MTASSRENDAFERLTRKISAVAGIACDAYKERCLRRRIAVRMRARGVHTFDEYADVLDREPRECRRLVDALTINVTKFYRNAETWDALRTDHLPDLLRTRHGQLRCWSAGCASGEEAYTIALVLCEVAAALGTSFDGVRIDATDLDPTALERARNRVYPASALSELPIDLRDRYFEAGESVDVPHRLRAPVRFHEHDLTRASPPHAPYDLICCRNVIIYFDRPMQERLFEQFADALRPGGLMVLGKVETLFGANRSRFELVNPRERIYRRAA